jgi:hypothetical protein
VSHRGDPSQGHYLASVRVGGAWWRLDDARVTRQPTGSAARRCGGGGATGDDDAEPDTPAPGQQSDAAPAIEDGGRGPCCLFYVSGDIVTRAAGVGSPPLKMRKVEGGAGLLGDGWGLARERGVFLKN